MNLIIINGMPATGKTTVARTLSERLAIPTIAKDAFKEFLFDTLGVKDREWSRTLGGVSNGSLYLLVDTLLSSNQSIIIENAFERKFARPQLEALIQKYHPNVIEIYCTTEQTVRRKRFMKRNQSGDRHIGHLDHTNYLKDDDDEPIEKFSALKLSVGEYIEIDTTQPDTISIEKVINSIKII